MPGIHGFSRRASTPDCGRRAPEPAPSDSDRRRAFRFPADLAATCRPLQAGPNTWAAVIQDVSGTGVRLRLTRRFEPGAVLAVQVPHGEGGAATLYAKVVWVRRSRPLQVVRRLRVQTGTGDRRAGNAPGEQTDDGPHPPGLTFALPALGWGVGPALPVGPYVPGRPRPVAPDRAAIRDADAVHELEFARGRNLASTRTIGPRSWDPTMTPESPATTKRPSPHSRPRLPSERDGASPAGDLQSLATDAPFRRRRPVRGRRPRLLDRATESRLSFSLLYLLPVTACAWCGGFSDGILLSLGGSVAWHLVDWYENPALPASVRVWNGVIRFGTLALMSSLVSRLRVSIVRERLLARTDPLTGAANGRTFYETAGVEAERARARRAAADPRLFRPGQLQAAERPPRPRGRGRGPPVRGADDSAAPAQRGPAGPARRRRVRAAVAGGGDGGGVGPAVAVAGAPVARAAAQGLAGDAERRRRDVPSAAGGHRPDDPARGRADVRGQADGKGAGGTRRRHRGRGAARSRGRGSTGGRRHGR